jgi:polyhydroxyalkanoate synthesis regulator phasin
MDEALEKMTKLASDLCDQLEAAEAENKSLKEQLQQVKTASAAPAEAPAVSEEVAQATCDALVKAGSISADQVADCKEAFMKDAAAAHRVLVQLLNEPAQVKSASSEEDVSGGTLVNGTPAAESDKYAKMYEKLGLYF